MRFEDLNWFDIEEYLKKDDRLMIVLGSCEQHAYLSLTTDVKIPLALGDTASKQSGVLLAPPVHFGISPYFLQYPGTISLRISTLLDLVEDVLESVYQHGFRRILILNGHGGNEPVKSKLYEMQNRYSDIQLAWYAWWQSNTITAIAHKHNIKPAHANWLEAFPFTIVSELPEESKTPPFVPGLMSAAKTKAVYGDGNFGGPYQVEPEIMTEIFDAATHDILHLLKFEG